MIIVQHINQSEMTEMSRGSPVIQPMGLFYIAILFFRIPQQVFHNGIDPVLVVFQRLVTPVMSEKRAGSIPARWHMHIVFIGKTTK